MVPVQLTTQMLLMPMHIRQPILIGQLLAVPPQEPPLGSISLFIKQKGKMTNFLIKRILEC